MGSEADSSSKVVSAVCPSGKVVIGGGGGSGGGTTNVALLRSEPSLDGSGWSVEAHEVGPGTNQSWSVGAWAICVVLEP
ncbi:MAG: hypothetical protein GEV06_28860 [Luteitalea sp.]|nr:hypothetical protein [Luteitalea sp.]